MNESRRCLLEISVGSVEAAMAAERGGADRIELCREQNVGGLTPSSDVMREARKRLRIPIYAMIRPRAGDFVYSTEEFAAMREEILLAQGLEMDGIVLGILTKERRVDVARTRELVEMAEKMEVTFHRAIDETTDLLAALEAIVETGAERILTSGGKATALEGAETIARMIAKAKGRIGILPGAGIHAGNIREVARKIGATEYHAALSSVVANPVENLAAFEGAVRQLAAALAICA
jgi:copper homeostasis protein